MSKFKGSLYLTEEKEKGAEVRTVGVEAKNVKIKESIDSIISEEDVKVNDKVIKEGKVEESDTNYVAKIGETMYETLKDAIEAVEDNETIELLRDASGSGINVPSGKDFTLDLRGHTYIVNGQLISFNGTETNGFQLSRDSNITIKNGKITTTKAKILIQNYSNLTLDNVDLEGSDETLYVLSNNNGYTVLENETTITAEGYNIAFDVYYWPSNGYKSVTVEIADTSVQINGRIEYERDKIGEGNWEENAKLIIPEGYDKKLNTPVGYYWTAYGEGKLILRAMPKEEKKEYLFSENDYEVDNEEDDVDEFYYIEEVQVMV